MRGSRTTQRDLNAALVSWLRALWQRGVEVENYVLVHHSGAGYRVEEILVNDGHAHSLPMGHTIRSAGQMYDVLRFATDALYMTPPLRTMRGERVAKLPASVSDSPRPANSFHPHERERAEQREQQPEPYMGPR